MTSARTEKPPRPPLSWRTALVGLGLASLWLLPPAAAEGPQKGKRLVIPRSAVVNMTELAAEEARAPRVAPERIVVPWQPMPAPLPVPEEAVRKVQAQGGAPLAGETLAPPTPSPRTMASFEALGDPGNAIPPDTQGTVGPSHLMTTLNTQVRVQTRAGATLSTVSLGSFWTSTGASGVFDPKLIYDPAGRRWVFTALSNSQSAASSVLIGVSQTSDPTGNWSLFRVDVDAGNANWADYPSLGFNKDWIVVTVNMFAISGNSFTEGKIFVFDKGALYFGNTANVTVFTDGDGFTLAPALTYDNSAATLYLVMNWNGNFMGNGFLRLTTLTGAVGSETYDTANAVFVATSNPWSSGPPGANDFAPQKGTTAKIQTNDSRLLSLVYRNGSLWAAQTAFLPAGSPTRSAVQWWQFLPDGTVQQFGRVDDSTGARFFAFPSLAVNAQDDLLLGYASFSAFQFASGSYSFRVSGDPANTLRASELLKAGEATYFKTFTGTRNRWGDYSNAAVDPRNDLDFWTIQEYASSPNFGNGDNRWGTWWGRVSASGQGGPAVFTNAGTITINDNAAASPYPSTINVSGLTGVVTKVVLRLHGFSHAFPVDVDALLVGPTGASATVFSDVGGTSAVNGLEVVLDDAAPFAVPEGGPLTSNTYQPFDITTAADAFPGPAPTPSGSRLLSEFNGTDPNGTWSLYVVDDRAQDTGSIGDGWTLEIWTGSAFSNSSAITINDNTTATPYPSTIDVAGFEGEIGKIRVVLRGFQHTFPDDVDVLLVGPTGASAVIFSDVGGGVAQTGTDIILDDAAGQVLPDAASFGDGTFRPWNQGTGDAFPNPAPAHSDSPSLSVFNGTDPNGTWSLYVVDDSASDAGQFSGGWTLLLEQAIEVPLPAVTKKRRGQVISE